MPSSVKPLPITVFTGFLGSGKWFTFYAFLFGLYLFILFYIKKLGKTTTILNLLKRVPENYKVCLLKNEFGDIAGIVFF
jgi:hypothetical protein